MFNPKEALQRIRRMKHEKQEAQAITEDAQPLFSPPKSKPTPTSTNIPKQQTQGTDIEDRVSKLQLTVLRLTEQLSNSSQTVEKLKRENSNLETQILKLEYENSQLKSNQVYSSFRRNGSNKKLTQSIPEEPSQERQREREKPRKTQSQFVSASREVYSMQVEEIVEDIKNDPIDNVLRRKQYQFRARKPDQKQNAVANRYLKQLASLQKQYGKCMRKPVLAIKLDDADFQ